MFTAWRAGWPRAALGAVVGWLGARIRRSTGGAELASKPVVAAAAKAGAACNYENRFEQLMQILRAMVQESTGKASFARSRLICS